MKKYFKPNIHTGIDAIYYLSIGLETWCKYVETSFVADDKSQMVLAAKILHQYFFRRKLEICLVKRIHTLSHEKLKRY